MRPSQQGLDDEFLEPPLIKSLFNNHADPFLAKLSQPLEMGERSYAYEPGGAKPVGHWVLEL